MARAVRRLAVPSDRRKCRFIILTGLSVAPYADTLGLDFGPQVRDALPKRPMSTMFLERISPRYPTDASSRSWLDKLGIS